MKNEVLFPISYGRHLPSWGNEAYIATQVHRDLVRRQHIVDTYIIPMNGDGGVSDDGRLQGPAMAERLQRYFAAHPELPQPMFICSPMQRARETMEFLCGGAPYEIFPELAERSYGITDLPAHPDDFGGLDAFMEILERICKDIHYRPDGGESLVEKFHKLTPVFDELQDRARHHPLVVVSRGDTLRCIQTHHEPGDNFLHTLANLNHHTENGAFYHYFRDGACWNRWIEEAIPA